MVFSSTKNGWPGSVSFFTYILWLIFLFRLRFIFPLFLGLVLYANEFKTKEKQKLTEIIKKINGNICFKSSASSSLLGGVEMKHWCLPGPILTIVRP